MGNWNLNIGWPVKDPLYFYLEAIEAYHPDCRVTVTGRGEMLMLGGYSYFGLNGHPRINQAALAAIERYGTGAEGARLLAGTLDLHRKLESRISDFKQTEAAVTFSSGYTANLSTISCLMGRHDTVLCDRYNHASIIDGCRLSRTKFVRFRHNDMDHLEQCLTESEDTGRRLVVVDGVFSMDGDIINLPVVSRLCRKYGAWLMVDEAHSVGVLGRTGHGLEEFFDLPPNCIDIKMGTLSKAIPSVGGYVAGTSELCQYLLHESRAFIYSHSLSPPATASALAAFDLIEEEPEHVMRLQENIAHFSNGLREVGLPFSDTKTPIFPIICGDDYRAWRIAGHCQMRGIYVQAIPSPVVPKGTARLRACVTAAHRPADLDYCSSVIREAMELHPPEDAALS